MTPDRAATRAALTAERARVADQLAALQRDFDALVEAATGVATDDEHDPEGSTLAFERAQVSALLDQARAHLRDLDLALERVAEGTYGVCQGCGQPIAAERLAARPGASRCIGCAGAPGRR